MKSGRTWNAEELLVHAGFLRALALHLVGERHADDIVQETLLAACQNPPGQGVRLRAWLGVVTRNLSSKLQRSERRRASRERAAAVARPCLSTAEAVAKLDSQKMLLQVLRDLREPYRSTLIERYYEGLAASEIARAHGLPVATVRTRIQRGLDLLRQRLDQKHGGDRAAWIAALSPLCAAHRTSAAVTAKIATWTQGVLVMATKTKIVGAVVLALAGMLLAILLVEKEEPLSRRARASRERLAPPPVGTGTGEPASPERRSIAASAAEVPSVGASPVPGTITGLVLVSGGKAPQGATVTVRGTASGALGMSRTLDTAVDGSFRVTDLPPGTYILQATAEGFQYGPWESAYMAESRGVAGVTLRLEKGAEIRVRVSDPAGTGVPNTPVELEYGPMGARKRGKTDQEGNLVWGNLGWAVYTVRATVGAEKYEQTVQLTGQDAEVEITIGSAVQGIVLGPDGQPLPGADLNLHRRPIVAERPLRAVTARTDDAGRYRIVGVAAGTYEVLVAERSYGGIVAVGAPLVIEGAQTLVRDIRIGGISARGRVLLADTERPAPVARTYVVATMLDAVDGAAKTYGTPVQVWPGEDGHYALYDLPPGTWKLAARDTLNRYHAEDRVVVLNTGQSLDRADFDLRPIEHGDLVVRVLEADGRVSDGLRFRESRADRHRMVHASQSEDGAWHLSLETGTCEVSVFRNNVELASFDVEVLKGETSHRVVKLREPK